MKIIKPPLHYILLVYFPIFGVGMAIAYFFPNALSKVSQILLPAFLLLAVLLLFHPPTQSQPHFYTYSILWPLRLALLQLGASTMFWSVSNAVSNILPQTTSFSSLTFQWYLQTGLYPWPMCALLACALLYFVPKKQSPLQPIFKNTLSSIFGIGIDFFIKQGIILAVALTLAFNIIQIYLSLYSHFTLSSLFDLRLESLVFIGFIYYLLATPQWRRYTRYLQVKRLPLVSIVILLTLVLASFLLLFSFGMKFLTLTFSSKSLTMASPHYLTLYWLLFSSMWWTCWTPVIASRIAKIASGQSMRSILLHSMLLPIGIAGLGLINQHWPKNYLWQTIQQGSTSIYFNLLLACIGILLASNLFQDPKKFTLVHMPMQGKNLKPPVSLPLIRNLALLISSILIIALITKLPLIVFLTTGISLPIFFAILGSCIGILFATYKHSVKQ